MSIKFYQFKILIDSVDFEKYKKHGFISPVLSNRTTLEGQALIANLLFIKKDKKINYEVIIYRRANNKDELIIRKPDKLCNKHKLNLQSIMEIIKAVKENDFQGMIFEKIKKRKVESNETKNNPTKSKRIIKRKTSKKK